MILPVVFIVIIVVSGIVLYKQAKDFWHKEGMLDERDRILDAYTESKFPVRETNKFLQKYLINHETVAE